MAPHSPPDPPHFEPAQPRAQQLLCPFCRTHQARRCRKFPKGIKAKFIGNHPLLREFCGTERAPGSFQSPCYLSCLPAAAEGRCIPRAPSAPALPTGPWDAQGWPQGFLLYLGKHLLLSAPVGIPGKLQPHWEHSPGSAMGHPGHGQGGVNPPWGCAGFLLGCCWQKQEKIGFIKAFIGSGFQNREYAEQITELLETFFISQCPGVS